MLRSYTDSCVYILKINKHIGVIPIYVDDAPAISSTPQMRIFFWRVLASEFNVRYIGPLNTLLGIDFCRMPDGSLQLSQAQYIRKVLERFQMQDCNPVTTPMDMTVKLRKKMGATEAEKEAMNEVPYRQAVGALMYIARATRYDIAHPVNVLAQYGADPEPAHWVAVKRILRYLKGTLNQALVYQPSGGRMHYIRMQVWRVIPTTVNRTPASLYSWART